MNHLKYQRFRRINYSSYYNDKVGQGNNKLAHVPLITLTEFDFIDLNAGQLKTITDLELKEYRCKRVKSAFCNTYSRLFKQGKITVLLYVVNADYYHSLKEFIRLRKREFSRRKIRLLGYIWCRDIGDEIFKCHYHLMIAIERVTDSQIKSLNENIDYNKFNFEKCRSITRFTNYLKRKILFGGNKKRSYGYSSLFKKPLPHSIHNQGTNQTVNFLARNFLNSKTQLTLNFRRHQKGIFQNSPYKISAFNFVLAFAERACVQNE